MRWIEKLPDAGNTVMQSVSLWTLISFVSLIFSANVWSLKILEVRTPGLNQITIGFTLKLNDADYVGDEITIIPDELSNMTLDQKKTYIQTKIKEKCQEYIKVYDAVQGLKVMEGQEATAQWKNYY